MALINCPECSTQVSDQAIACNKCGYPINKPTTQNSTVSAPVIDKYYEDEFHMIKESAHRVDGGYGGKWNWYSWFFTWIWYFVKGCYVQGIINVVATIIYWRAIPAIQEFLYGFAYQHFSVGQLQLFFGAVISINAGFNGTWYYYNAQVLKKQFVSPKSANIIKTLVGIVIIYLLMVFYEYMFMSDYYHKGMGSH